MINKSQKLTGAQNYNTLNSKNLQYKRETRSNSIKYKLAMIPKKQENYKEKTESFLSIMEIFWLVILLSVWCGCNFLIAQYLK